MDKNIRRLYFRLKTDLPAQLECQNAEGKTYPAQIIDISANGIGVLTDHPFKLGDCVLLRFHLPWFSKDMAIQTEVIRQTKLNWLRSYFQSTSYPYLTGFKYLGVEATEAKIIRTYVSKTARFHIARWLVLILALLGTCVFLTHASSYLVMIRYLNTRFGGEWLGPAQNGLRLWSLMGLHLLFSSALAAAGMGFFLLNRTARKLAIVISSIGIIAQVFRIVRKWPFFWGDCVFQSIYNFEIISLAIFSILLLILTSKNVRLNFDIIHQRVIDYRDGRFEPFDMYNGRRKPNPS
ncbi:MAG: PilZ domain-containing protein [Candidatus Omnitrophica bacterium]|nr:PilZ domain-containing protein [Candidatus Omnitrophota bacterium]